jgi:hypothetical protein
MKKVVTRVLSQMTRHASTHPHPGIDRRGSPPTRVLVKYGDMEMWIVPGGTYNNRGKHYVPGNILLVSDGDREWRCLSYARGGRINLQEGSRISKKKIAEWATKIDEFFGVPVAHLIDAKMTVWIEDADAPAKRVTQVSKVQS